MHISTGKNTVSHLLNICVCNDDVVMVLRWEGPLTWATHDNVRQPLGEVQNVQPHQHYASLDFHSQGLNMSQKKHAGESSVLASGLLGVEKSIFMCLPELLSLLKDDRSTNSIKSLELLQLPGSLLCYAPQSQ